MPNEASPNLAARPRQAFILGWSFSQLGGVNEVVRNLVHEYSESGPLAPLVIEPVITASGTDPLVRQLSLPAPFHARRPWRALAAFCYRLPSLFRKLRALCDAENVQVLNPHFIGLEYFSLMLFRRFGGFHGPLLLSFHGSDIRSMMRTRGFERFLSRLLLRGADLLIPCSEGLAEEIALFVPECAGRIASIPNGIDVDRFLAKADPSFSLPEPFAQRRKIVNIGAFEYKKGHDTLLRAFAQVHRIHPDVCLIIAGQPREKLAETEQLIQELGLTDHLLLLQNISHNAISALLQIPALFALSSRWEKGVCGEGFAMALLEAAAAGRPVVSTHSCGVTELIEDGVSGLIVPTGDPDRLASALCRLLDNPAEADRLAANLHRVVRQDFTWKAAHARYLELTQAKRPPRTPFAFFIQTVRDLFGRPSTKSYTRSASY